MFVFKAELYNINVENIALAYFFFTLKRRYCSLYCPERPQEQLLGQKRMQTKYDPVELFIREDHSFSI